MPAKNSLFQQGGWATQLSCDNPALVSWLKYIEGARQTTCSLLGVECTTQEQQCEQVECLNACLGSPYAAEASTVGQHGCSLATSEWSLTALSACAVDTLRHNFDRCCSPAPCSVPHYGLPVVTGGIHADVRSPTMPLVNSYTVHAALPGCKPVHSCAVVTA